MLQAVHAGWIIPIRPKNKIFCNHTLLIENSRIVSIVPTSEWSDPYEKYDTVDCTKDVLIPGLINTQAGAPMSLLRGVGLSDHRFQWINRGFLPENCGLPVEHFTRDSVLLAGAEMLLSGTTCFSDICICGEEVAASAISLGMRSVPSILITTEPSTWAKNIDDYLVRAQSLYDKYRSHPLVKWTFATQMADIFLNDSLHRLKTIGDELDIPLRIKIETEEPSITDGFSALKELKLAELINTKLIISHVPPLTRAETQLIRHKGVNVCHTPSNSIKAKNIECDINALKNNVVNVGLGTDSASNNSSFNLFKEIQISALKYSSNDRQDNWDAFDILELATLGGARVLGLEEEVGSLEPGKSADIVSIKLDDSANGPIYNIEQRVVSRVGSSQVKQVWVRGKRVVENGILTTIDSKNLINKSRGWGETL